jgi:hypothetical protein
VLVVKQAVVLEGMIDSLIGIGEWCGLWKSVRGGK